MYETEIDYKLSIEDFLYVMSNLPSNIIEKFIDDFSCLSVKYIISYLESGNKKMPNLEHNDFHQEGFTSGDSIHIFKDKSGVAFFTDEKYIHVSNKAKDVEGYLLFGVCFNENEPYIFMPKETLIISKNLNVKIGKHEKSIAKMLGLKAKFSKSNQGKRKIRDAEAEMLDLEREVNLEKEKGFYRL